MTGAVRGQGHAHRRIPFLMKTLAGETKATFSLGPTPPVHLPGRKERRERGKEEGLTAGRICRGNLRPSALGHGSCPPHHQQLLSEVAVACLRVSGCLTPNQGLAPIHSPVGSAHRERLSRRLLKVKQPVQGDSELCKFSFGSKQAPLISLS